MTHSVENLYTTSEILPKDMVLARRMVRGRIPALMAARTAIPAFAAQADSPPSAIFAFESMPAHAESNAQAR